jgi:adenylate cyclase class 2
MPKERCEKPTAPYAFGSKEQVVITFKGPRKKGRFKQRQEIQFEVGDPRPAEQFLAALGYGRALVFQKSRRVWRLGKCEVALDKLPLLGTFVEIEGPDEKKIAEVQKKLGLADLPHIPESYAVLMERKLRKLGRKSREVFL